MDVLAPNLMWIDKRCYRVPSLDFSIFGDTAYNRNDCEIEYENDTSLKNELENMENEPGFQYLSNGRCKMVFPVASSFLPFIIGSKGSTIQRIRKDSSCTIFIPKFSEKQNITIFGSNKEKVYSAWKSILLIISSSRKKLSVTHFISFPMNSEEIKKNFLRFKEEVLSTCKDKSICEELFQIPEKLHLTATVLVLLDDNERQQAEKCLLDVCNKDIRPMLEGKKPCIFEVKGIDYMNDDPTDVPILYANVQFKNDKELLQEICNKINDSMKDQQLKYNKVRESIKLHVTLMNKRFLNKDEYETDTDSKNQMKKFVWKRFPNFNATSILENFKDFYFGEQELSVIHLSVNSTHSEIDGYYKNTVSIEL